MRWVLLQRRGQCPRPAWPLL
ncbi:hypothetical protein NGA_0385202 [Nannochloropsis gaditana CCMP526]|nr:hypothetical protein NGA_0385202 [Nannochloropsis gaditana CCMP526]EKU22513.1 hypothetical protein NGA_0385202 [Nannochloropsis gaditana CCMP526]|eukprot:XP_005853844.1 hypothetical protein NGA_0385202 [Nannochloropsis gaditana CCMP526]